MSFIELDYPSTDWEHALIVGNGHVGAMLYGKPGAEVVVLNCAGLFAPVEQPRHPPDLSSVLPEIRSLIADGRYREAADLAVSRGRAVGLTGLVWTDPFVPVCDVTISYKSESRGESYLRRLDYSTGVATVTHATAKISVYASRADDVAVLRVRSPDGHPALSLSPRPSDREPTEAEQANMRRAGASVTVAANAQGITGLRCVVRFESRRTELDRASAVRGVVVESRLERHGTEATALVRMELIRQTDLSAGFDAAVERLTARLAADLERLSKERKTLFSRHIASLHESLGYTVLSLEDDRRGQSLFESARYEAVSATGDFPPTLTGVWGGSWAPLWSADFTMNGNFQTAIEAFLPWGLPTLLDRTLRHLESFQDDFRYNAWRLYGARGVYVPARMSSRGLMNHFNETYSHIYWVSGAAWISRFFYDYYLYTGDRAFLRHRALPFMLDAARFLEDFLGGDFGPESSGQLVFSPSYSPENSPGNVSGDVQVTYNATMDVDATRLLFTDLIDACTALGVHSEDLARWRNVLDRLPDYRVNDDGAVAEWATPTLRDNYTHRHASHLYRLFYERPAVFDSDPALERAFKRALDKRMEYRRADSSGTMAFGLVQLAHAAISLRDRQTTGEIVDLLISDYWTPEQTSTHDRGALFNCDICGGLPSVMMRAIVDSTIDRITLLPALPPQWKAGGVSGVHTRGGHVVDVDWQQGELSGARVLVGWTGRVKLRYGSVDATFEAEPGATIQVDARLSRRA